MTTTLEQAARWVAEATGLRWPDDRAKVIQRVNDVRELLYDISVFAWQTAIVLPIRQFQGGPGIALPRFAENVLGVYNLANNRPIPVVDRWGVYPFDENTFANAPKFNFQDFGEQNPFLNDPDVGCYKLVLLARSKKDVGKIVTVRFVDGNDLERTEEVKLGQTAVETQHFIKAIELDGVSLPLDLCGPVRATTGSGKLLVEWQPWEHVPGYRRLRFNHDCRNACAVIAHIERRREPLYDNADPVETSQKLIWQDGARYLLLHSRTNGDSADAANAAKFLASFTAKVEEAGRRLRGRTHKRALQFVSNTPRRSGLWRGRC